MTVPAPFKITWEIDQADWREAADIAAANGRGSTFDERGYAFYSSFLNGRVQMWAGTTPLFGRARWKATLERHGSLARRRSGRWEQWVPSEEEWADVEHAGVWLLAGDFVVGMARVRAKFPTLSPGQDAHYGQSDDAGVITFRKLPTHVHITTNWRGTNDLTVDIPSFVRGCDRFLHRAVRDIEQHAPELLTWNSFEPLSVYRQSVNS